MTADRPPTPQAISWRWSLGVGAALFVVSFWPLLVGQVWVWGLPALQYYPWYAATRASWLAGDAPLWNPLSGGGEPLLAAYQVAPFYLFNLAYQVLPHPSTIAVLAVLHLAWAAFGMFRFTALLPGSTPLSQTVAGLTYAFSGIILQRADNFAMLAVAAWAPWLLWAITHTLNQPTARHVLIQTAVAALILLAGHAQWSFYVLLFAGVYALGWLWVNRLPPLRLVFVSLPMLWGLMLAAAQLLPTAELLTDSSRVSGLDYEFTANYSFPPVAFVLWLTPFAFGHPGLGTYLPPTGTFVELSVYLGLLPLLLLGGAIRRGLQRQWGGALTVRQKLMLGFGVAAIITLLIGMGGSGPLFPTLYHYVPTFNLFQAPVRWLLLTTLCLAALTALTLPAWQPSRYWTNLSLAGSLAATVGGGLGMALGDSVALTTIAAAVLTFGLTWAAFSALALLMPTTTHPRYPIWLAAVLLITAADLAWAAYALRPTAPASFYDQQSTNGQRYYWPAALYQQLYFGPLNDDTPPLAVGPYSPLNDYTALAPLLDEFRAAELPNLNLIDGGDNFASFNPLRPAAPQRYAELLDQTHSPALFAAAAIARDPHGTPLPIRPNQTPDLGRAWAVPIAQWQPTLAAIETALLDPNWQPAESVLLLGNPLPITGTPLTQATLTWTENRPNRVTLAITSDGHGWLVLADTYTSSWQATRDGLSIPIYQANLAFRAVAIPPGESTLTFTYQPRSWQIGLWLSGLALFGWIALLGYTGWRGKR